eukprot:CAMPEP_0194108454 /NCGR_PEP_ID=MMETSP0150-20130528/8137_1 /TAXON_ID=122233 /ORGANISM="Chaetoceros debilis, Strain MM31A-1" /LENGTH=87 /DNA_ID=CAMNT_0038797153 /DNA_START=121 /DNA_END=384 /DNA_ORIENTATION=+
MAKIARSTRKLDPTRSMLIKSAKVLYLSLKSPNSGLPIKAHTIAPVPTVPKNGPSGLHSDTFACISPEISSLYTIAPVSFSSERRAK